MVYSEKAKMESPEDLKEFIMNEEGDGNATINGLFFIETKANDKFQNKVFPCYIHAYTEVEKEGSQEKELVFMADIIQYVKGEFEIVKVYLHEGEFNISKRIWDKPPTKGLRNDTPWVEEVVQ